MGELSQPEAKVKADARSLEKSADSLGALDSSGTADGSQPSRPKSSSSEGMHVVGLHFFLLRLLQCTADKSKSSWRRLLILLASHVWDS
jgi:hypothetical protein